MVCRFYLQVLWGSHRRPEGDGFGLGVGSSH